MITASLVTNLDDLDDENLDLKADKTYMKIWF